MEQQTPKQIEWNFDWPCGMGKLVSKLTKDTIIREGRISVPHIGQCIIRGTHPRDAKSAVLELLDSTRKVVGSLTIDVSTEEEIRGRVILGEGSGMETFKLVAYARRGKQGRYRALRIPDIIDRKQLRSRFGPYSAH